MVLGTAMNHLRSFVLGPGGWILLLFGLSGCGDGGPPMAVKKPVDSPEAVVVVTDTAKTEGQQLDIISKDGQCVLRVSGPSTSAIQEIQLAPKSPCHFLRISGSASPRKFQYADINTEAVYVVSGTPASERSRAIWKLDPGLVCGEESQGIIVRRGKVLVSQEVNKGGISCRDIGVDEKVYWAFAHEER